MQSLYIGIYLFHFQIKLICMKLSAIVVGLAILGTDRFTV
jgi:hypothetical protein